MTDPAMTDPAMTDPARTDNVIELRSVSRTFPGTPPVEAVRSVDMAIGRGEYVSIVGRSGSGKSSLLNVLGCLDTPDSGDYFLDGVDVLALGEGRRTALRGSRIGFIFQSFHLLPYRSVVENVMTGLTYRKMGRRDRRTRSIDAVEKVGLSHRIDHMPTKLSGGERQRVAIARALAGSPAVLLCDEPTGNLDSATTDVILDVFDDLVGEGLTIVVVTHDDQVSDRAERIFEMKDGHLGEVLSV